MEGLWAIIVYHHYTDGICGCEDALDALDAWMYMCVCLCMSVCVSCVGVDARCKMQDALIGVTFAGWSEDRRGV